MIIKHRSSCSNCNPRDTDEGRDELDRPPHGMGCLSCTSHILLSTSVNAIFPSCAFCANLSTSQFSNLSPTVLHIRTRAWISADWVNIVWPSRDGTYCIRSKHVANCDSDRLTEEIEAVWDAGSTNDISRTNASSVPPKNLTIHPGVFCLHPRTLSVRMIPVLGSMERSMVSTVRTWAQCWFGYLCHMPIRTWDHGWLYRNDVEK